MSTTLKKRGVGMNDDLINLENLPDMDDNFAKNVLDLETVRVGLNQTIEKKEAIQLKKIESSDNKNQITVLVDTRQFPRNSEEKKDVVDRGLDALADLVNLKPEKRLKLDIREETRLFYEKEYYVGDIIDGQPKVYNNLLCDAMTQSAVHEGLIEEVELGKYRYSQNFFAVMAVVLAYVDKTLDKLENLVHSAQNQVVEE